MGMASVLLACSGSDAEEDPAEPAAGSPDAGTSSTSTSGGVADASTGRPPSDPTSGVSTDDTSADSETSSTDDTTTTTGDVDVGIPVFIAQGMIGRTVISCDDGHTWVADRAWDAEADPLVCGSSDPIRCWEGTCAYLSGGECASSADCDCGHHPGFSKGIVYGDGQFVATWGWGYSGSVRRSLDGVHWEETLAEDVTFGGLAYGADRFVLASRSPMVSPDGVNWTAGQEADFRGPDGEVVWSVRRFAYADYDGGRFIATANPPQSVLVSSDGGNAWWAPSEIPDGCLADISTYGGIAYGDGVILGVGSSGVTCRSTDGGDTWILGSTGGAEVYGHLLWTGSAFVTWGPGVRYTSPDGQQWFSDPTTPQGVWVGPAAHSESTGSFVAVSRVWDGYESQTMMRSDDGLHWDVLPADAFAGGHPLFEMTFGYAEPSEVCPK